MSSFLIGNYIFKLDCFTLRPINPNKGVITVLTNGTYCKGIRFICEAPSNTTTPNKAMFPNVGNTTAKDL